MIAAGSGEKRIELDETTRTIEDFLMFVTTGCARFASMDGRVRFDETVNLIAFLRKYGCDGIESHLRNYIRAPWHGHSEDYKYLRMLAAMHLEMPDVVAELIRDSPEMFAWLDPAAPAPATPTADEWRPRRLAYAIFEHIPNRYLWALMAAGVFVDEWVGRFGGKDERLSEKDAAERFLWFAENAFLSTRADP